MRLLDWIVVASYLTVLTVVMVVSRRYVRTVAAYLVAGRLAGRYLLTGSSGMMWLGLAVAAAEFEKYYEAGLSAVWWTLLFAPLGYLLAASGWINFRFRSSEAMTLGQFFEMRYSPRFRIFAGVAMLFAGLLNYGVFPGISAEIIVAVTGWPREFSVLGLTVATVPAVVAGLLTIAVGIALFGGFVAILVADFIQSQLFYLVLLLAAGLIVVRLGWPNTMHAVFATQPAYRLNPYQPKGLSAFNPWFFVLLSLRNIYNYSNWPSGQGFLAAATTPHEAKMAGILGEWRNNLQMFGLMALAFGAFALLHQSGAAPFPAVPSRALVPAAIASVLPVGLLGLFCSVLIGASLARDNTDLLTWGTIFIQDILLPLRGKPFTPRHHLLVLRGSVLGAALFVAVWSWFFPLRQYVWLYLNLSGSVYLAGSGIVVIGGLYWRRAPTAAAWSAMIVGAIATLAGLSLQTAWPHSAWLLSLAPEFPLDGMWIAFWASAAAVIAYLTVVALKPAARAAAAPPAPGAPPRVRWRDQLRSTWSSLNLTDRLIYAGQLLWSFGIGLVCLALTFWNFFVAELSPAFWRKWWIALTAGLAAISTLTFLWILIGGTGDLAVLLSKLRAGRGEDEKRDRP